ncbi:bifunctional oligoribonuclease/PAP phosphatase NrnA [Natronococcus sp. JC468]|uniref:DHH family phosphoesterase n=1 Tax=Natronococcus sp. JC468 TaxID=1961921 RepID=UPI00143BF901|nr:bifunctional oligoribonuclease/PAP phosphatase NrnA [Natronococcus sp. JC468]NKE37000.1 bifunctional oligoribonuclease/PAP phosphatase NrnA [Natronococcus sp. JC468]
MSRAADLVAALEDRDSLAIVCHDNPDPDCLASALALEAIAREAGVDEVAIAYGGEISHQQNRAFVALLEVSLRALAEIDVDDYDAIAFVDHSRPGANTELPATVRPEIVVDHHPGDSVEGEFADVRVDYGATATIFVDYLEELGLEPTSRLASALLFALHRERLDFVRNPSAREYEAALDVFPNADLEVLNQLYGSAFSAATLDAIGRAIATRQRRESSMVATVGRTPETDALPQAADYLLNLEGVDTVLVYGVVGDAIRLSARSIDPAIHIGEALADGFDDLGSAGGHHDMAGGRIELSTIAPDVAPDARDLLTVVGSRLPERFFAALEPEDEE